MKTLQQDVKVAIDRVDRIIMTNHRAIAISSGHLNSDQVPNKDRSTRASSRTSISLLHLKETTSQER